MGDGKVATAPVSEYGKIELQLSKDSLLWENVPEKSVVWMSHTDYISEPPKGFEIIAKTDNCPCAAMQNVDRKLYAVQFHPEAHSGPHDTGFLFGRFVSMMEDFGNAKG